MGPEQTVASLYIAGMEGFSILGLFGFLAFCVVIVFMSRGLRGKNVQWHEADCQCRLCQNPKAK